MLNVELVAVGTKAPDWVSRGLDEYLPRLKGHCQFSITEIRTADRKRSKPVAAYKQEEGKGMLSAIEKGAQVIALDGTGNNWSTEQFAQKIQDWSQQTNHFQFLVGGPDGLSDECRQRADTQWSLSNLTFPHFMVRVFLAEQIYRALMFNNNHPYHK